MLKRAYSFSCSMLDEEGSLRSPEEFPYLEFYVVLVRQGRIWTEVATFRSDLSYEDGRHPIAVAFGSAEEDAQQQRDHGVGGEEAADGAQAGRHHEGRNRSS